MSMLDSLRSKGTSRTMLIVGVALAVVGAVAWFFQLTQGLLATSGMGNSFVWGLMIAMFAFMVGFGAGSQLVCTVIYLACPKEFHPIARIAAACGLGCVAAAGIAILADLGAIRNILAMIVGLNLRSPLAWDMIAMTAFLVLSVIQIILMIVDSKLVKPLAVLAGLAALALQVVEGLLFSLQEAHAWWHTSIMPIDFVAVAFVSGAALLLLIAAKRNESPAVLGWLARFLAVAIAVHLVLAIADMLVVAFEGGAVAGGVLSVLWTHWWLYALELGLPICALVILHLQRKSPGTKKSAIAAIVTIIGIFAHRLMLLYPAYDAPALYLTLSGTDSTTGAYPFSTGRYLESGTSFATSSGYTPSLAEWGACLLPLGVAIIVVLVVLAVMKAAEDKRALSQADGDLAYEAEPAIEPADAIVDSADELPSDFSDVAFEDDEGGAPAVDEDASASDKELAATDVEALAEDTGVPASDEDSSEADEE